MKSSTLAAILSTPCFLLASCATTAPQTDPLRPDLENPHRMVCESAPERPSLPSAYVIDWAKVKTVEQARAEHEKAVASIYERNGLVTAYLLTVEGRLFVCSNNAQWWRHYWADLGD